MLRVVQPDPRAQRLERALKEKVRGEVRFDAHSRLLYSTDASLYQILPVGVVLPRDAEDVEAALRLAAEARGARAAARRRHLARRADGGALRWCSTSPST